jgi:cleavage stimulation factor subunit 3
MLARPLPEAQYARIRDYKQLLLWKDLITFEKSNPQKLELEKLKERIDFTYRQALTILRFYPEIWNDYAEYHASMKNVKEGSKILKESITVMPESILMHCLYASYEENCKNFEEARRIIEDLLSRCESPLVWIVYMQFCRRCFGIPVFRKAFLSAVNSKTVSHEVYVAAARIEHQVNKEPQVASRIYNLGLKFYKDNSEFLKCYIQFLESLNDHKSKFLNDSAHLYRHQSCYRASAEGSAF